MTVILYERPGESEKKIATAYPSSWSLADIKAQGWSRNLNNLWYYSIDDEHKETLPDGGWRCTLTAVQVQSQGELLETQSVE